MKNKMNSKEILNEYYEGVQLFENGNKEDALKKFESFIQKVGFNKDLTGLPLEQITMAYIMSMSCYNTLNNSEKSLNKFRKLMKFYDPYLEKIPKNEQKNYYTNPELSLKTLLSFWHKEFSFTISDFWLSPKRDMEYVVKLTCILFEIKEENKEEAIIMANNAEEFVNNNEDTNKLEDKLKKLIPYIKNYTSLSDLRKKMTPSILTIIFKLAFLNFLGDKSTIFNAYKIIFIHSIKECIFESMIEEREKQNAETIINTQKEMLSFLTHTLRNTLSAGPQTARTITENLRDLLGDKYIENNKAAKTINKAISLLTTFNYVDNLIDTFKLFSSDKATISKKWENENEGDLPINALIAKVIVQIISRILYYGSYLKERKILFGMNKIKQIKESFLDIVLTSFDTKEQAVIIFEWLKHNCPKLELNLCANTYNIKNDGLRFGILFSIISELLSNSISYFDGSGKINVTITENENSCKFECNNHYDASIHDSIGTNKGLSFIKHIIKYVDDLSLDVNQDKDMWRSKLLIKK